MPEHLQCTVERITYQNQENGFAVLKAVPEDSTDSIPLRGTIPFPRIGAILSVEGHWEMHPQYGRQFHVESVEEVDDDPTSEEDIEKYLANAGIKGIGKEFAKRIVSKFGTETLAVLDQNPNALLEVDGIGPVKLEKIKESWNEQRGVKKIMMFFLHCDVSVALAHKIYRVYGNSSIDVVKENPYRLADDIQGIGFKTADKIAGKLGFAKDKFVRLRSGILYTLKQMSDEGHCYAERGPLISSAEKLLEVEIPKLEMTLDEMIRAKDVIKDNEAIYLQRFYYAEIGCARHLARIKKTFALFTEDEDLAFSWAMKYAKDEGIIYNEKQKEAIRMALSSKVMVLTGGPGTGKTTTLKGIIKALSFSDGDILLAAPTGKAAKRMSEATKREAKTIHRLLKYKPDKGFTINEYNKLEGRALIVDECSMIDVSLMNSLLKSVPNNMTMVLVGDADQLPSVGAGNVLWDIISSGAVPVIKLTEIYRQEEASKIITNAHRINKGEMIDLEGGKESDFFFMKRDSHDSVVGTVIDLCARRLPAHYHVNPLQDIQVLSPMRKGDCGTNRFNELLQQALNPQTVFLESRGVQYRLNDRVMQIRNNYDKAVYNGDVGTIVSVSTEDQELEVNFDGNIVCYDVFDLDELVLSYASTIHKSQGSEYPIVVIPFIKSHFVMLQRNLLYTAVTRAKDVVIIVGEKAAVAIAIRNEKTSTRNTKLAERLLEENAS